MQASAWTELSNWSFSAEAARSLLPAKLLWHSVGTCCVRYQIENITFDCEMLFNETQSVLYLGQFRTITNLFLKSSSSKCRSTSTTARWIHATPVILVYEKELAMFSFAARFPAILQVHGDFLCNQVIMITRFLFIFYYHCVHNICKKYIWHYWLSLIT